MAVDDAAAAALPSATTRACRAEIKANRATKGKKTTPTHCITTSIFARRRAEVVTGADMTRSGASSPEIAIQARPPASCPAVMIKTGMRTIDALLLSPRVRHKSKAGGNR
jgi:hypothetical protein